MKKLYYLLYKKVIISLKGQKYNYLNTMHRLKKIISHKLNIPFSQVKKVDFLGGMTNKNYLVLTEKENGEVCEYVLRIPGAKTECLISRTNEALNSKTSSDYGFNVETCYFDADSGIKITKYLKDSQTLDHSSIQNLEIIKEIADNLKALHTSEMILQNTFNVFDKYDAYFALLENKENFLNYVPEMPEVLAFWQKVITYFDKNKPQLSPCHNDLVPENILYKDRFYFIDWEYSGMNDLYFDLAAFLLESRLNKENEQVFLQQYFAKTDIEKEQQIVYLYQFTQDLLWTLWTVIKEENNEFFGDYGQKRIARAIEFMHYFKQNGFLDNEL